MKKIFLSVLLFCSFAASAQLVSFKVIGDTLWSINPSTGVTVRLNHLFENINNTSDLNKPISTLMQAALDSKSDLAHSHAFAAITGKPTTLSGYGITDAATSNNAAFTGTFTVPAGSIAYSKLNLTGAVLNADLAGSIAYSKLNLTGAVLNADLAGSIAYSKLSLAGAILNTDLAGSIAYSKLNLTGAILNADLAGSITESKLLFANNITGDLSTSQHGFAPKAPNVATQFLRGDATYDVPLSKWRLVANALGSVILYEPPNQELYNLTTSTALASGTDVMTAIYIEKTTTLTGVKFWQVVQGSYTADQVNGIALYSYSGGNITQVATSANDGTIWKAAANTLQTVPFTGTYSAAPGVYFIVGLYHSSAQTTAPTVGGGAAFQNGGNASAGLTNSAKVSGTFAAQTTLATPMAMSSFSTTTAKYYFALY